MNTIKYLRLRIFVSGKVQGVYYRQNTVQKAQQMDVFGWVRNLKDGRVEAVLEGKHDNVHEMLEWCKSGPKDAIVTNIDVLNEDYTNEFSSFKIIESA